MLYASLIEEAIREAEQELLVLGAPIGVRIHLAEMAADAVETCRLLSEFGLHHIVYINFADDAYMLAASPDALSCAVSVLSRKFALIGQFLAPTKCEVLAEAGSSPMVRLWDATEVADFVRSRRPPEVLLCAARDALLRRPSRLGHPCIVRLPAAGMLLLLGRDCARERPRVC